MENCGASGCQLGGGRCRLDTAREIAPFCSVVFSCTRTAIQSQGSSDAFRSPLGDTFCSEHEGCLPLPRVSGCLVAWLERGCHVAAKSST